MSKKEQENKTEYGVNLVTPNVSKEKFEAIKMIAESNLLLAQALNSVHTEITMSNNVIHGANIGISVQTEQNK